jgi:hypothetical protein
VRLRHFIFSMEPRQRITRHLVFWGLYCGYFFLQSISLSIYAELFQGATYKYAFYSLCCFVPICILSTYLVLYLLLPATLLKRKYVLFCVSLALIFLAGLTVNYFAADLFLHHIHYTKPMLPNFLNNFNLSYCNTIWAVTISCLSVGIKLTKSWYLQQEENLQMAGNKTRAELQLQKGRVHPAFLFRSLDSLHAEIITDSGKSPDIVLKLADLLSYSLYESEAEWVPLENEIAGLKDLIALEQVNGGCAIELEMNITAAAEKKYIAPMALLSFLHDSMGQLTLFQDSSTEIKLVLTADKNRLNMYLKAEYPDNANFNKPDSLNAICQVINRIDIIYQHRDYNVRLVEKDRALIVLLNLPLIDNLKEVATSTSPVNTGTYAHA